MIFKYITLFASVLLMVSAFVLFYIQPAWIHNNTINGQTLYGHLSSFKLTDVSMKSHQGDRVVWSDYSGHPLYISLGFTSCPNACPLTMLSYQKLVKKLNNGAKFSLLTVDPKRDTEDVLNNYLQAINQDFLGLIIEDDEQLNKVTAEFKQSVFVSKANNKINHKGYIYLVHPNVNGMIIYHQENLDIEKMVDDFNLLTDIQIKEGSHY